MLLPVCEAEHALTVKQSVTGGLAKQMIGWGDNLAVKSQLAFAFASAG